MWYRRFFDWFCPGSSEDFVVREAPECRPPAGRKALGSGAALRKSPGSTMEGRAKARNTMRAVCGERLGMK